MQNFENYKNNTEESEPKDLRQTGFFSTKVRWRVIIIWFVGILILSIIRTQVSGALVPIIGVILITAFAKQQSGAHYDKTQNNEEDKNSK